MRSQTGAGLLASW